MYPHETGSEAKACPPVLVLAFNRPDTTQRVLESLRAARPGDVFFAVDGPRAQMKTERQRVIEVRRLADTIDWACRIHTLFREENLGCKLAVSQAITWFFAKVEAGVVVEDDLQVAQGFLTYLNTALDRYRAEPGVMQISAHMFPVEVPVLADAFFLPFISSWGWATWDRAWRTFDPLATGYAQLKSDARRRHAFNMNARDQQGVPAGPGAGDHLYRIPSTELWMRECLA